MGQVRTTGHGGGRVETDSKAIVRVGSVEWVSNCQIEGERPFNKRPVALINSQGKVAKFFVVKFSKLKKIMSQESIEEVTAFDMFLTHNGYQENTDVYGMRKKALKKIWMKSSKARSRGVKLANAKIRDLKMKIRDRKGVGAREAAAPISSLPRRRLKMVEPPKGGRKTAGHARKVRTPTPLPDRKKRRAYQKKSIPKFVPKTNRRKHNGKDGKDKKSKEI